MAGIPSIPKINRFLNQGGLGVGGILPVITGTPYPGNTLTSTAAGQWRVNGVDQAETGTTYVVKVLDIGKTITQVGASNSLVVTGDTDALAYIQAVETADAATLEEGVRLAIHNHIFVGLKTDGEWTRMSHTTLLAGPRTLAGCAVPLKGTAPTLVNFVSGDLNRKTGIIGNASSKYINTNRAINTSISQNNHAVWVWVTADASSNARTYMGGGVGNSYVRIRISTGTQSAFRSLAGEITTGSATLSPGLLGFSRNNSANFSSRRNGISTTHTATSNTASSSLNIMVFATNEASPSNYTDARIAMSNIGTAWTSPENIEARITAYLAAINTAIA